MKYLIITFDIKHMTIVILQYQIKVKLLVKRSSRKYDVDVSERRK